MSYPKTRRGGGRRRGGGATVLCPSFHASSSSFFFLSADNQGFSTLHYQVKAKKTSLASGHCPVLQPNPRACLSYVSSGGDNSNFGHGSSWEIRVTAKVGPVITQFENALLRRRGGEDTEEGTPPFHIPLFVVCRLAAAGKLKSLKSPWNPIQLETYLKHFSGQNCYTNLPPPPKDRAPKIFILIRFDGK